MGKAIGSERLGDLYKPGGKTRKRREWRGVEDTFYDYTRWLGIMKMLATYLVRPHFLKGFLRYRWIQYAIYLKPTKHYKSTMFQQKK